MARQLIDSMSVSWKPADYKDEYRSRLTKVIEQRIKQSGRTTAIDDTRLRDDEDEGDAATNVVDFTALLKKSLASNRRTPAAAKAPAKKATNASGKSATRKTAKPKAKAAKSVPKTAPRAARKTTRRAAR